MQILVGDVKAIKTMDDDTVALYLPQKKVQELHALIGKTRMILQSLPNPDMVLRIDFEAQILSTKSNVYTTHLNVGRLRTRIVATPTSGTETSKQTTEEIHFWPMWNDEQVEFADYNRGEVKKFVKRWNRKAKR